MKKILILIFFIFSFCGWATNYYVSNSGNDLTGNGTIATPYATLSKIQADVWLVAGDSVLLKRGDSFYGSFNLGQSGTVGNDIVISAYGTGAKPIITGFITLTTWTDEGGGIYSKTIPLAGTTLMVSMDNVQQPMGRYPNTGWLYFESHSGVVSITDNQLPTSPNYTGAEAVIRRAYLCFDRNVITNHTAQTLTITDANTVGDGLEDGYGYFIQNALDCLDSFGEWYYGGGKFYMYFGSVNPVTKTVKVSSVTNLFTFTEWMHDVTIDNINFIGSTERAINILNLNRITVKNCDIDLSGKYGVEAYYSNYITIDSCNINRSNDLGILSSSYSNNVTVKNCTIDSTEILIGQGITNHQSGVGMNIFQGNGNYIFQNTITNSSYDGISFGGDRTIVRKNFVNGFCINKTDGGGIYYGNQDADSLMVIDSNIVINAFNGTEGMPIGSIPYASNGIYIDYGTVGGITIDHNTVANCEGSGIFYHASNHISATYNTVFNCNESFRLQETDALPININNLVVSNNVFIAKGINQITFWSRLKTGGNYAAIGTFNNNVYARPINDVTSINAFIDDWSGAEISLSAWKTLSGQDVASIKSPFGIKYESHLYFDYNASNISKTITLPNVYKSLDNVSVTSYTLDPFESIVLLTQGIQAGTLIINSGKTIKY